MKKILLKYLNLYVLSGLLLVGFAGCSDDKDNDPVNPGPDVEELPSIGTYCINSSYISSAFCGFPAFTKLGLLPFLQSASKVN